MSSLTIGLDTTNLALQDQTLFLSTRQYFLRILHFVEGAGALSERAIVDNRRGASCSFLCSIVDTNFGVLAFKN